MDSIDSVALVQVLRRRYEWSRFWRALLGFAPACALILIAAYLSPRSISVLLFGAVLFGNGVLLLWYGQGLQRAVLPGVLAGLIPLTSALCANHFGHVCTGGGCMSLCLPACILGGVSAGAVLGYWARRRSWGFLLAASGVALLTGAMGCGCIGYAGVFGLLAGYAVGLSPILFRPKARPSPQP
jgi:hypothetical protein